MYVICCSQTSQQSTWNDWTKHHRQFTG